MTADAHREFKSRLYAQFARVGKALDVCNAFTGHLSCPFFVPGFQQLIDPAQAFQRVVDDGVRRAVRERIDVSGAGAGKLQCLIGTGRGRPGGTQQYGGREQDESSGQKRHEAFLFGQRRGMRMGWLPA